MSSDLTVPLLDNRHQDTLTNGNDEISPKLDGINETVVGNNTHVHGSLPSISCVLDGNATSKYNERGGHRHRNFLRIIRIMIHMLVVPLFLIYDLYTISCPLLGLYFPVLFFAAIGYFVPFEFFLICSVIIVSTNHPIGPYGGVDLAYVILLLLSALMTSLVGWKKFNQLQAMEVQNRKKYDSRTTDDDYYDDENNVYQTSHRHPVPAGPELDALRLAEALKRRESKQRRQEKDKYISTYGIPLDQFDAVV